ncbi:hypothetical protein [Streptococcus dysgalactiae]|uniref:hypothetical protein n=1 Tax=Streptococcus dysgalactiae TaxID=1334 RepID=UPI000617F460|nr:hypothetical protein [Streptococcus dysgalactiae]HEP3126437.1 hypothetical protein [Streptococcus pyogenes]KKC22836.1 hypothetical protein WH79_04485 [Streptococcus dysgalactiae subsp. equisimilis]MCB2845988.1 hypothetical protein [Streptococcus dysgalactiae subsp. dysgalactiae]HEP3352367.1 hypothetical protein [Streptococcus pyogenes]HEP4234922.1 hypothetical protein [Streptococcus pyogenes]
MAVSKFYAKWKKPSGEEELVNAFDALALKGRALIETSPKEKASLYDIETDLKVAPKHGYKKDGRYQGQPYFTYYPGEESPLKGMDGSFEYSSELNAFIEAFKSIKKFQIGYGERTAFIFPKAITPMKRVVFEDEDFVILKLWIEIDETYPYSEYYRLNGQLGIEFYKTKHPESIKRIKLAKEGVPLLEAKAQFPESTKIYVPEEFVSSEQIRGIAERVREVYQERNYKLYGTFNKYHLEAFVFLDDNERKYHTLKTYEEQCQKLESEIKRLSESFHQKNEKVNQLREEIKQAEIRLRHYCEKEEYYNKLEKDNELLKQEKAQLRTERQQLTEQSQHLREERDAAQEETKSLRSRSFWQRLFNK